jgi:hypothetical protein
VTRATLSDFNDIAQAPDSERYGRLSIIGPKTSKRKRWSS